MTQNWLSARFVIEQIFYKKTCTIDFICYLCDIDDRTLFLDSKSDANKSNANKSNENKPNENKPNENKPNENKQHRYYNRNFR